MALRPYRTGLALLISAGVAGLSLWGIGLVAHVAEPAPTPTVTVGPQEQVLLCNDSTQSVYSTTCNGGPTPVAVDSAYIGPGHRWVVAANLPNDDIITYRPPNPGMILETNPNASRVVSGLPVNCALQELTYPGSGARLAAECSLFGPARCPTGETGGGWGPTRLLTLNLTTGAVEHNVTLPAGMDSFPTGLWRDPGTGLVVGVTYNRSQIFTIDPSTGRTTLGPELGVDLTIAGYDPTRELLYASGAMRGDARPANLTVVNVTSLRTGSRPGSDGELNS